MKTHRVILNHLLESLVRGDKRRRRWSKWNRFMRRILIIWKC